MQITPLVIPLLIPLVIPLVIPFVIPQRSGGICICLRPSQSWQRTREAPHPTLKENP